MAPFGIILIPFCVSGSGTIFRTVPKCPIHIFVKILYSLFYKWGSWALNLHFITRVIALSFTSVRLTAFLFDKIFHNVTEEYGLHFFHLNNLGVVLILESELVHVDPTSPDVALDRLDFHPYPLQVNRVLVQFQP